MIYIKRIGVVLLWYQYMQRRGVTGNMIYFMVHSEDRGGIITEEISDMMMMVMVPTDLFTAIN